MNDSTHSSCNTLVKNTKMEFFKYIAKLKHKNEQNKINNTNPKQNQLPPQSYRLNHSFSRYLDDKRKNKWYVFLIVLFDIHHIF